MSTKQLTLVADLGPDYVDDGKPMGSYYEERFVVRGPENWQDEAEAIRLARARQGQGVVVAIDGVRL